MALRTSRQKSRAGFTAITGAVLGVGLLSMLGFAVDIGRMYINKNESQTYVDSAAIQAAQELDGTLDGITRARNSLATNPNKWNFGTAPFTNPTIQFATSPTGDWTSNPSSGDGYRFVTVNATVNVPIYFLRVISAIGSGTVINTRGTAGQGLINTFREGTFPFSPMSHNNGDAADFGLTRGGIYTMRWAASPSLPNGNGKKSVGSSGPIGTKPIEANNICYGDAINFYKTDGTADDFTNTFLVQAQAGGGSERGYIEDTSASIIRQAIVSDYQTAPLTIGSSVNMTGGAKNTEANALAERIGQDTDPNSARYADYVANGRGNGRRIVLLPINTYNPNYTLLGFRAFFLLPASTYTSGGGNDPFCAEYIGPYTRGSAHAAAGNPGAYVIRLVN